MMNDMKSNYRPNANSPVDLYPIGHWQEKQVEDGLNDWIPDPTYYQPFQRCRPHGDVKLRFSHLMHRIERLGYVIKTRRGYHGRREYMICPRDPEQHKESGGL